jgi:hypothetical protein
MSDGLTMAITKQNGPIEVWLSQQNMKVTCRVVYEDESVSELDVDSLSMRGAQREITGYLIGHDYRPVARWEEEEQGEVVRRFTPAGG